ncbi:MAG TPA: hypothetical protein DCM08_07770 [Microscillaceae bacterium]|nr:hypothetical protein [Microscillaceae bacterium]
MYQDILEVVQAYAQFKSHNPEGTLKSFGLWLLKPDFMKPDAIATEKQRQPIMPEKIYEKLANERSIEQEIGYLFGRLNRYARAYAKKGFGQQLDLSLDEFGFLAGAGFLRNPTKSALINETLSELTTGTEIMRRLIKLGYLKETNNEEDKRSKRIHLTPEGEQALNIALAQIGKMAKLICANLNETQKETLLEILVYLDQFHLEHFFKNKNLSIEEIIAQYLTQPA